MHEYSIVASLIDRVEHEAGVDGATRVNRLYVAIGELSGVERELLQTAFETFRERSICGNAELSIRWVAARWTCPDCVQELDPEAVLRCRLCGRPAKLRCGDEIVLERIEMEAPDV